MRLRPPNVSTLSRRMVYYILLASSVLAVLATIIQLGLEYQRESAEISSNIAEIERSVLPSIARSLWLFDKAQTQIQAQGIMNLPGVEGIRVRGVDGSTFVFGSMQPDHWSSLHSKTLYYPADRDLVGTVEINVSYQDIFRNIQYQAFTIFLAQTIKAFLVSLFMLSIFHEMITRHLIKMANYAKRLNVNYLDDELVLDRHLPADDELQQVCDALNDMRCSLKTDIAARQAAENILFSERERATVTLASIIDAVITTDPNGIITYINPIAENLTGWPRAEAIGMHLGQVFCLHRLGDMTPEQLITFALNQKYAFKSTTDIFITSRDGCEHTLRPSFAPLRNANGEKVGIVLSCFDKTESLKLEQKLSFQETHDQLTGLLTRTYLTEQLLPMMQQKTPPEQGRLAMLSLDLDMFKHVNDAMGHSVGDHLLQEVAHRLSALTQAPSLVSRHSGDEFFIALVEFAHLQDITHYTEQVLHAITTPYLIQGRPITLTASIGIALFPQDGDDLETLVKHASAAQFSAKEAGRNTYRFFTHDMREKVTARTLLEDSLRHVNLAEEFVLHYQPQVRLDTGEITGVEALVRWYHPQQGIISPVKFIPLAEETGLIVPLGEWILRQACQQAVTWQQAGLPLIEMSINLSGVQFRHQALLSLIETVLAESRLPPQFLKLELTESVLMDDSSAALTLLQRIKQMGIKLSIDDFGTGYSSLSYLKRFPLDTLKIDRSFILDIPHDPSDCAITQATIGLAKGLGLDLVAEGVETTEQCAFLAAHGCNTIQGYYFSPPVDAEHMATLLRQRPFKLSTLS